MLEVNLIHRKKTFLNVPLLILGIISFPTAFILFILFYTSQDLILLQSAFACLIIYFLSRYRYGILIRNYKIVGKVYFNLTKVRVSTKDNVKEFNISEHSIYLFNGSYQNAATLGFSLTEDGIWKLSFKGLEFDFLIIDKKQLRLLYKIIKEWYALTAELSERYKNKNGNRLLLGVPNYTYDEMIKIKNRTE